MKRLGLILAVVTLLIGGQIEGTAQKSQKQPEVSSEKLRLEVCQALSAFLSSVDAASSEADSQDRAQRYADAEIKLLDILKKYNAAESLSQQTSAYVRCSEQAAHGDPTAQDFPKVVAEKLAIRSSFVERCAVYGISK